MKRADIANVHFEAYRPKVELGETLSAADVHLVSLRPELEGLIVPSKIYGIKAVGRPAIFIGAPDGEIAHMLNAAQCGCVVAQGDGDALAAAIEELAHNPDKVRTLGFNARKHFERTDERSFAVALWEDLLAEVARWRPDQTSGL